MGSIYYMPARRTAPRTRTRPPVQLTMMPALASSIREKQQASMPQPGRRVVAVPPNEVAELDDSAA